MLMLTSIVVHLMVLLLEPMLTPLVGGQLHSILVLITLVLVMGGCVAWSQASVSLYGSVLWFVGMSLYYYSIATHAPLYAQAYSIGGAVGELVALFAYLIIPLYLVALPAASILANRNLMHKIFGRN